MNQKRVVIVGATAPDAVKLIEAINRAGSDEIVCEGFVDDNPAKQNTDFLGYPVLGTTATLAGKFQEFWVINNVARDMPTRRKVMRRLDSLGITRNLTLVHPSVDMTYSTIGDGCMVQEGVVVGPLCEIGAGCVIYAHAVLGHECILGDTVFVANNAIVGARSRVGEGAFVGLNAVVLPYLKVGPWSTIGAGSVVLQDVEAESSVFGNPARRGVRPQTLAQAV